MIPSFKGFCTFLVGENLQESGIAHERKFHNP
jgi:hypothetical protein